MKVTIHCPVLFFLLFGLLGALPAADQEKTPEAAAARSREEAARLLDEAKEYDKNYDDGNAFLAAARARAAIGIRAPRQWSDEDRKLVGRADQQMKISSDRLRKTRGYLSGSTTLVIGYPKADPPPKPRVSTTDWTLPPSYPSVTLPPATSGTMGSSGGTIPSHSPGPSSSSSEAAPTPQIIRRQRPAD
ncbi:MAG: hypothetical protein J6S75_03630 [Thermoguttaceae bacterium]|nr:hypothetical protein [Thermoguttaceae bacterium]